jgi:peptidoglycan/LPS O-acetylase OafA/YrhL
MGFVRLFLAVSVVAAHSGGPILGIPFIPARQAVLMFYVVSGFYMALILNEKYTTSETNRVFWANR